MQSIAVMEFLRVKARVRDPMLIVAPLTTLGHWRREIETWTTMNTICYMGGKDDRVVRPVLPAIYLVSLRETWKMVLNIHNFSLYAETTGYVSQCRFIHSVRCVVTFS